MFINYSVFFCFFPVKVRHYPTAEQLYPGQDVWHHVSGDWTATGKSKSSVGSGLWKVKNNDNNNGILAMAKFTIKERLISTVK